MKIISLNFSTIFFHHFCLPVLYLVLFLFSTINVYGEENLDPEVNAESAILMDADTGVILYEKNKTHKTFPASITKIMTALLTLESAGNSLSDRVAFSHDAVFSLPSGSSNIAMNEGDTLSVEESLYGLLLASANEVANALAEHIGGAQEDFAVLMNQKAQDLGAVNTHFVNPSGLHDDEHYTCAYDMALFLREALKDPEFNAIIAMKHYDLPPTEKQPLSRPLNNTNKLIQPGGAFFNENVIGGKTGFTDQAQHTLATYAEKDGVRLITVVLHNEGNDHYTDTNALLNYGFADYHEAKLFDSAFLEASAKVIVDTTIGSARYVPLMAQEDIEGQYPSSVTAFTVETALDLPEKIVAPVQAGDPLGKMTVRYQGAVLGEVQLYAKENVEPLENSIAAFKAESSGGGDRLGDGIGDVLSGSDGGGNRLLSGDSGLEPKESGFKLDFGLELLAGLFNAIPSAQIPFLGFAVVFMLLLVIVFVGFEWRLRRRGRHKDLLRYINRRRKKPRTYEK